MPDLDQADRENVSGAKLDLPCLCDSSRLVGTRLAIRCWTLKGRELYTREIPSNQLQPTCSKLAIYMRSRGTIGEICMGVENEKMLNARFSLTWRDTPCQSLRQHSGRALDRRLVRDQTLLCSESFFDQYNQLACSPYGSPQTRPFITLLSAHASAEYNLQRIQHFPMIWLLVASLGLVCHLSAEKLERPPQVRLL